MPDASRAPSRRPRSVVDVWRMRRRWRQGAALALLALAAALHLSGGPRTSTALVASSDLAPGHVLSEADLEEIEVPAALVPVAAVDAATALGRAVAFPVGGGEILTSVRLDAGIGAPRRDRRIVSIPVPDAGTLALLHPGTNVDVYAMSGDSGAHDPAAPPRVDMPPSPAAAPAGAPRPEDPLVAGAIVTEVPHDTRGAAAGTVALDVSAGDAPILARASVDGPLALGLAG